MHKAGLKESPRQRPRRTNVLRHEDAEEPGGGSHVKIVPKDFAPTGKQFLIADNWKTATRPNEDLGLWLTLRAQGLQESGEYRVVQHELPRSSVGMVDALR